MKKRREVAWRSLWVGQRKLDGLCGWSVFGNVVDALLFEGVKVNDISKLVPKDKFDNSNMEVLKTIDIDKVKPILEQLLNWMQDINWPVAQELIKILPRFHFELISHIKIVFNSNDDDWKNWVLCLMKNFPRESVLRLSSDIKRIAQYPTIGEMEAETNMYANEVIEIFNL